MILSQITRSDVRFELLLSTSAGENLSPEVSPVAQTVVSSVSQTVVAVVGPGTIAVVAVVGISIGSGLSISGPLAVVVTMVSIRVSESGISTVETRVGVWVVGAIGEVRISLSLRLGLWLTGDEGGKANHKSELHC